MKNLQRFCQDVSTARRKELIPYIYHHTGGKVYLGPFRDMIICPYYMWGDSDIVSKLLGVYEDELHQYLYRAKKFQPDVVINVGCAEGYYAIGCKKMMQTPVIAVDIDPRALEICKINAISNNTEIDYFLSEITSSQLNDILANYKRPLLVIDCEGYEEDLLNKEQCPRLTDCMILVETHDVFKPNITSKLSFEFQSSHDVAVIEQSTKDPYKFEFLKKLSDSDKFALIHEGRPEVGYWLWMEPK
jgi:hypothetical protein